MSQEQKDRWNATRREKRAKKREESDPKVQELRAQLRTLELSCEVEAHRLQCSARGRRRCAVRL